MAKFSGDDLYAYLDEEMAYEADIESDGDELGLIFGTDDELGNCIKMKPEPPMTDYYDEEDDEELPPPMPGLMKGGDTTSDDDDADDQFFNQETIIQHPQ